MSKRKHMERASRKAEEQEATVQDVQAESHQALKDDMDAILDEIDLVLESNAEEFVSTYVQRGGE